MSAANFKNFQIFSLFNYGVEIFMNAPIEGIVETLVVWVKSCGSIQLSPSLISIGMARFINLRRICHVIFLAYCS